ncbi:MAG: hypothetical protein ACTH30_09395 [Leucobacter sp.]
MSEIQRRGALSRAFGGSLTALAVAALVGCSSAAPEKPEASEPPKNTPAPAETAPEPAAEEPTEFPMPAAAGDPGQSLEEACALLYAGSAIHQEGASALNLKDTEELARELPRIVSESQAEFVKVGNPQAAPIATEYSKQVALMSQAMLGGEYAMTEIAAAGAGVQAVVDDAVALCPNP